MTSKPNMTLKQMSTSSNRDEGYGECLGYCMAMIAYHRTQIDKHDRAIDHLWDVIKEVME